MRKILISCILFLAAGCAGSPRADSDARFADTTGDGLPDARAVEGPSDLEGLDGGMFSDTDRDGLPDERVGPNGRR